MDILLIGGSGFLSGTIAREARAAGHRVWAITRGNRQLPKGVIGLTADRKDREQFAEVIQQANLTWDLVVDVIPYEPDDTRQDLQVLPAFAGHLVMVSTDFVYEPVNRRIPRTTDQPLTERPGYGYQKRLAEQVLLEAGVDDLPWTILRPCHIYGPGSQLGCLPACSRTPNLLAKIAAGEALPLVGGGILLQQPILARDLAKTILSCAGQDEAIGGVFNTAGPDVIESREYYRILAEWLEVELKVEDVPMAHYLGEHPQSASFLCHRVYDLQPLRDAGLHVPDTPIEKGLQLHAQALRRQKAGGTDG